MDACAPLLLWALHFFGAYVFAAASCTTALADTVWFGQAAIRLTLIVWTIAALLLAGWLLLRACRALRETGRRHLLSGARAGCAALGLLGIVWTALPLLTLSACMA
ncbi:MAG TPA: hypothetical protein VN361_12865 [Oxalicibacterium sp.]|nr:hypothetical protein [Oxalicibacterium sp.]